MNSICLCMIVKDESAVIKRCLDSIKSIIDFWIIVDTGSTDNTKNIISTTLSDVPGMLIDREWVNFGHNRTELVQLGNEWADRAPPGEGYLLLLDADMVINVDPEFKSELGNADGYAIRYNGNLDYAQQLLVRGDLDWKYVGVTHEYIECNESKVHAELKHIHITHYCDGSSRKDKFKRDVDLLEKEVKKDPENSRNIFYLAQSYRDSGDALSAQMFYGRRASMKGWDQETWYSMYQVGAMLEKQNMWEEALDAYLQAYSFRPSRAEPLHAIISHYMSKKNYFIAHIFAQHAVKIPYPDDTLFVDRQIHERLIKDQLAVCLFYVGKVYESKQLCDDILKTPDLGQEYRDRITVNRRLASNESKRLVFGLGTGRCGTMSLQYLLNMQKDFSISHETIVSPWIFDQDYLDKLVYKVHNNPKPIVGDIAFYHLNYVEQIIKLCPDAKFVCLQRDKAATVESYLSWTVDKNHWTSRKSKQWSGRWQDDEFDDSYPKYFMSKKDGISSYWDDYYRYAHYLHRQYPHNFKLCFTEDLNSRQGQIEILSFVGCNPSDMVLDIGVRKNYYTHVNTDRQHIWMFWDNISLGPRPAYLDICEELVFKHCKDKFDIHVVSSNNVRSYLPNIRSDWFDLTDVVYKSEYIRYKLLHSFGGIWLDSDLIVMNDLSGILENMSDFAATYPSDRSTELPSSGLLASIPQGKIITKILDTADAKMESKGSSIKWGDLGPQHLWECLHGSSYTSLPPNMCMPIGYQDHEQFAIKQDIDRFYTKDMYCFMLYNVMFKKEKSKILSMNREELLEKDLLINQIFRKSFDLCQKS